MRLRKLLSVLGCVCCLCIAQADAQDLGHRLPGLLGLDAGRIPEPGLYLADRYVNYRAGQIRDRNGNLLPIGELNLRAFANAFGLSYTTKLKGTTFVTVTAAGPVARFQANFQNRPEAGVDRFGLGDIYVQPLRVGWRLADADIVTSYGIYFPTGRSPLAGGKSPSSGQVTHEFSVGGALYAGDRRRFMTALAGYQLSTRQRGIDIIRGDTLQVQGGIGSKLFGQMAEVGVAGYALWQVRDDRGADLPPALAGARDAVYGLGPEGAVALRAIHSQIRVRYEWDMGVRARPEGKIFVVGFNVLLWRSD